MPSHRQLFLSHIAQTSPSPLLLDIERAKGMYMYDTDGKQYLDLIAGISVSNIGHSHPAVVKAVTDQAQKHMHLMVYGELVSAPQTLLAQALIALLPVSLNAIYYTNSGTEATEGAMKLAKRFTGRTQIIHFQNSYHGSTQGALSVLGDEYFKRAYRPLLPDILMLEYGNMQDLSTITERTAAVILDPIQAESGVTIPTVAYMQALRHKCTLTGTLLILDEAQTAFGRCGTMFAFEQYGIVPDILLLAKAFGGGMPLGAFVADSKIMSVLTHDPVLGHITTFGGHPVSCAAALAALHVLQNETMIPTVEEKGKLFESYLQHPAIKFIHRWDCSLPLVLIATNKTKKLLTTVLPRGYLPIGFSLPHSAYVSHHLW